jgi:hypothetical protein
MATQYKLNPTRKELMDEMKNEKVAPPRGTTKQFADTFKEGVKPPVDPDMGSIQPVKKAKGGKVKKYADGGMTQQPTYPFYGNTPQAGGQNGGMNQTFNMQPQASAGAPDQQQPMQQQQAFKKGGKVSSASKRADGCAIRGKTRA